MTATAANTSDAMASAPGVRSATDVDWRRSANIGGILGITAVFIGLVGMAVGLDKRMLIDPVLSLGYLFVLAIPLIGGWIAAREITLEGMTAPIKGARDIVAGAVAGLVGGAVVAMFLVMLNAWDLQELLPNWSDALLDMYTFGQGVGVGIVLVLVVGLVLGAIGGAVHVIPAKPRRLLSIAVQWVISFAVLEAVIDDLLGGFGLQAVADVIYARRGGLLIIPGLIIGAIAAFVAHRFEGKGAELKTQYMELEPERKNQVSKQGLIIMVVLGIVLPIFLGKIVNELLSNVGLFILLALGLNVVIGRAGILDIGYVAFFAVGSYMMAFLTSPLAPWRESDGILSAVFGWLPVLNWFVALPIVVLTAAIVGVLIGTPVIRMRGDYLAIVTLGFGEIIRLLFLSDWLAPTFGGAQGIRSIPGVNLGFAEINGTDPRAVFYLVAIFVAIAIYVSSQLETSRLGRAWMAIREDESVAEAMGINTVTTKLFAFVVGAILASFSGAIFAAKVGSVFPNSFELLVSIIILVVVIVGGMGNIPGVMMGAVVLIGVLGGPSQPGLLQEFSEFKLLIYGALLVFMMLKKPEGLIPNAARNRELHQEEALQDAWLKGDKPGTTKDEVDDAGPAPSAADIDGSLGLGGATS